MNREERKRQLIAEGTMYRTEVLLAREMFQASVQPENLAQGALQRVARFAMAIAGSRIGPGLTLQTLWPMAISGLTLLSRRKGLLKFLLRGGLVAGVVAVATLATKNRSAAAGSEDINGIDDQPSS